jgi:hypothetical protein
MFNILNRRSIGTQEFGEISGVSYSPQFEKLDYRTCDLRFPIE